MSTLEYTLCEASHKIYAYADTEMKRKAIEQATSSSSPLKAGVDSAVYWKDDDEMIRRLYGLK